MQRWSGNLSLPSGTVAPLPASCVSLFQRDDNLATIAWLAAAWLVPPLAGPPLPFPTQRMPSPATRRSPHSLLASLPVVPVVAPLRRSCPPQFVQLPVRVVHPNCSIAAAAPPRTDLRRPSGSSVRDRPGPEAAGQGTAPAAVSG